jgi:hypothetical protein
VRVESVNETVGCGRVDLVRESAKSHVKYGRTGGLGNPERRRMEILDMYLDRIHERTVSTRVSVAIQTLKPGKLARPTAPRCAH